MSGLQDPAMSLVLNYIRAFCYVPVEGFSGFTSEFETL